jgi:hypothetical protein
MVIPPDSVDEFFEEQGCDVQALKSRDAHIVLRAGQVPFGCVDAYFPRRMRKKCQVRNISHF